MYHKMDLAGMTRSSQIVPSNSAASFIREDQIRRHNHGNIRNIQSKAFLEFCQSLPAHIGEDPSMYHHCRRRLWTNSYLSAAKIRDVQRPRQGSLIFEWPLRRNKIIKRTNRCIILVLWACTHALYFLYRTHILPTAIAIEVRQPPMIIASILKPTPRLTCTVIEPDW